MLLSHEATRCVLAWDAVRDRVIITRLSIKIIGLST